MTTLFTPDLPLGYVADTDQYFVFSEYYGDLTLYGARRVVLPSGEAVTGAGRTVEELVSLEAQVVDDLGGTIQLPGVLVRVEAAVPAPEPQPEPQPEPVPEPTPEPEVPQPRLYSITITKEKDGGHEHFSFMNVRSIEIHSEGAHCILRC